MRRVMFIGVLAGLLGVLVLGTAAFAGGGCTPEDAKHTSGSGTAVSIKGCKFAPVVLFTPVGAKVTWTHQENHPPHNVYGLGWGMAPGTTLTTGQTQAFTFERAGIFPYQCSLHPGMAGVIVVGDAQLGASSVQDAATELRADPAPSSLVAGRASSDERSALIAVAIAAVTFTAVGFWLGRRRMT